MKAVFRNLLAGTEKRKRNISISIANDRDRNRNKNHKIQVQRHAGHSIFFFFFVNFMTGLYIYIYGLYINPVTILFLGPRSSKRKEVARLKLPGPKMIAFTFAFTSNYSLVEYEHVLQ
jgi:hypothetical protein